MPDIPHSIKVVAKRTGLSPHVIRAWEKRYATVSPGRSDGNRRLYTAADIDRLALLRKVTEAGHSIGDIAHLTTERLGRLVVEDAALTGARPAPAAGLTSPSEFIEAAYATVLAMNSEGLEQVLDQGSVSLGQMRLLSEVIVPLVERIGTAWREGTLKIAQEHIASATIRTFLGQAARPMSVHPSAPVMVATTPSGQLHELGAILAAATATNHGWRVVYAGPSLPAEEIVSTVLAHRAVAVALSVVHPSDDAGLAPELLRLRRLLPPAVQLIVGGRAVSGYRSALAACGATVVESLPQLTDALDRLRQAPR